MAKRPQSGKKNKTKKATKATKASKTPVKAVVATPPVEVTSNGKLPSVFAISKRTLALLWANKGVVAGVTAIYGVLNLLLVRGLSGGVDVSELRDQFSSETLGSIAAFAQLLSDPSASATQAAGSYQLFLFVVISLAVIWMLRQLYAGAKIRVRDAFYKGMYPLVPFLLILLVIVLQLIPAVIGAGGYQLVVLAGIAGSTLEIVLWGLGALALGLVSLYWLASSIIALYVVTLPDTAPREALRMSRNLVRGRRWTVLRKMLFLPVGMLLVMAVFVAPFIFILPVFAGWVLFILGLLSLVVGHGYLYNLYQGLLHEQQASN